MKRWIFFLLLALAGMQGGLCAKRLPHVMRANGDAFLYFVQPFDVPSETKGLPPLNVDITYLTSSDTADVRMSLTWPQWVDAATLTIGERTYACQQLYVEQTRKGFLHRLQSYGKSADRPRGRPGRYRDRGAALPPAVPL